MKTSDIIRDLCAKNGISVTELEKKLGFSNGSLTKNNYIRSDRLKSIADYFNVSMEYLMTGKIPDTDYVYTLDDRTQIFIEMYKKASPDIQNAVVNFLEAAQHKS